MWSRGLAQVCRLVGLSTDIVDYEEVAGGEGGGSELSSSRLSPPDLLPVLRCLLLPFPLPEHFPLLEW